VDQVPVKTYFVIGPESSGTRVTTTILMSAGCVGDDMHSQRLDRFINSDTGLMDEFAEADMLVVRRSVPHGGPHLYPELGEIAAKFEALGPVLPVICVRDWYANVRSKIQRGHQKNREDGYNALQKEVECISRFLVGWYKPFYIFNTSLLFGDPWRALCGLMEYTGLQFPPRLESTIFNADAQYE